MLSVTDECDSYLCGTREVTDIFIMILLFYGKLRLILGSCYENTWIG